MSRTIEINRIHSNDKQSSGTCLVLDETGFPLFTSLSLERGWLGNQNNISCIPEGEYEVVLEWSNKFQTMLWEIKNVPGRSETKFHSANYWYQLNGCISLGLLYTDINNDGFKDVTASVNTMKSFHKVLHGETNVKLIVKYRPA